MNYINSTRSLFHDMVMHNVHDINVMVFSA